MPIDPKSMVTDKNTIAEAQRMLSLLDYAVLEPSGTVDDATRAAIAAFKKDQGIVPADGSLDAQTFQAIADEYKYGRYKKLAMAAGGVAALGGLGYLAYRMMSKSKAEVAIRYDTAGDVLPEGMTGSDTRFSQNTSGNIAEAIEDLVRIRERVPTRSRPYAGDPEDVAMRAAGAFSVLGSQFSMRDRWDDRLASVGRVVFEVASNEMDRLDQGLPPKGPFEAKALAALDGTPAHQEMIAEVYRHYRTKQSKPYR